MPARDLKSFLNDPPTLRNAWLKEPGLEVYVRLTMRRLLGERVETIDIASIQVKKRGCGYFTAFLVRVEKEAIQRKLTIFIENVTDERFGAFFSKRGYCEVSRDPSCFALFLA